MYLYDSYIILELLKDGHVIFFLNQTVQSVVRLGQKPRNERGEKDVRIEVCQCGGCLDDVLCLIKGGLLGDTFGEDTGLLDIKLRPASSLKTSLSSPKT